MPALAIAFRDVAPPGVPRISKSGPASCSYWPLVHAGSVSVGLEPVSVAVRSEHEVWVVNHVSDSVSVVDVSNPAAPYVARTLLAELVWEMHFDSDTNVVDVAVRRLRVKVDDPFERKLIRTVRGVGYVLDDD